MSCCSDARRHPDQPGRRAADRIRRRTRTRRSADRVGGGGTLFERMSNIARGAPKAQIDDDEPDFRSDPIDIPRFLNRQNNQ